MIETDVITHLINIESQVAELLLNTQEQADKQISEAKQKADEQVQDEYTKLVAECEKNFEIQKKDVDSSKDAEIQEYQNALKNLKQDTQKFNNLLNKLFLGRVNG